MPFVKPITRQAHRRVEPVSIICRRCGIPFLAYPCHIANGQAIFCSRACRWGTPEQRFWEKVDKNGPIPSHCPELGQCWVWTHGCNEGYGIFYPKAGEKVYAPRFSYVLEHGEIPIGLHILHHCDNPPCVRPSHLYAGTTLDNARDMMSRGRWREGDHSNLPRGINHRSAKLIESQVREIRKLNSEGIGLRRLSKMFKIAKRSVHKVIHRISWAHVA